MFESHVSFNQNILNLYGEVWHERVKRFAKLRIKRNKLECSLQYVLKCRDNNIVPKFMCCKPVKCIRDYKKFFDAVHNKLMVRVVHDHHRNIQNVNKDLYVLHLQLAQQLRVDLWDTLDTMTAGRSTKISSIVEKSHIKKFERLMKKEGQTGKLEDRVSGCRNLVVNLSSQEISPELETVLSKGLNFAPTPHKMPVESIITGIEDTIIRNRIPQRDAECLRQDVSTLLRKSKLPKSNITRQEMRALKELRKNPDLLVLPADKGNATVIVDTESYESKMTSLVSDTSIYKKVHYNPTSRITSKLEKLLSALPDDCLSKSLRPPNPTTPKIYGLPKIHKENWPLRPIVSQIDAPTYKVSRFMANILQPMTGKTSSYVKDSTHFTSLLKDVRLTDEEVMVSFDVTSLFTNVPVEDTINIIRELIIDTEIPTEYINAIEFCLKSGFFVWKREYYIQTDGVAMGSPIAPVVANIFMEWFEDRALNTVEQRPRCWWRYVDDVFSILHRDHVMPFLVHLNSLHANINFTCEQEKDGVLAFLDVLVMREPDGRLSQRVYRKPTHTDRYLRADSHHHPAHLASVPRSLINRALRLCDPQYITSELAHVRKVLESNGYKWKQSLRISTNRNAQSTSANRAPLYLPFIKGVTDKIGQLLRRRFDIKTIFRPNSKIRQFVRSPKDSDPLNVPGVYEVPCDCGRSYVGETGRNVYTRLHEHIRSLKKLDSNGSAIAEHAIETDVNHFIRFDKAKVLAREKCYVSRKIREAIEISRRPNFNRDAGWSLPVTWKPILQSTQPGSHAQTAVSDIVSSYHTQSISPADDDEVPIEALNAEQQQPPPTTTLSLRAQRAIARAARASRR